MARSSVPIVRVLNRQRKHSIPRQGLQQFAERALSLTLAKRASQFSNLFEIVVVLISDERMARLHNQFLGTYEPTDVITFHHGEIFISVETAARQAHRYRSTCLAEVELYLVHGILHLAGYDDSEANAAREMRGVQQRLVRLARRADKVAGRVPVGREFI